jgi:hypothetical protein
MRTYLMIPVLALGVATAAGYALATDHQIRVDAPQDRGLSIAQITERFASQGYDVREIKAERDAYEVRATDKDGKRLKAHVHPVAGEPLEDETDD